MFGGVAQRALLATGALAVLGSHISISDFGFILIALVYVVSVLRDWRPVRALREENRDLRASLDDLQKKYDDLSRKYEVLEHSRDFRSAFAPLERALDQARSDTSHEHEKQLAALETIAATVDRGFMELVKGLSQNTTATATLAAGINANTLET